MSKDETKKSDESKHPTYYIVRYAFMYTAMFISIGILAWSMLFCIHQVKTLLFT